MMKYESGLHGDQVELQVLRVLYFAATAQRHYDTANAKML